MSTAAQYNNARHYDGPSRPIQVPITIPPTTEIKGGDLMAMVSGVAVRASDYSWTSDLATTQAAFHDAFCGVSRDEVLSTTVKATKIAVGTAGDYKYPCDALASAGHVGDLYGPAQGTGNTLAAQKVVKVDNISKALFQLIEEAPVGATTVKVRMFPALTAQGGIQTAA